jgi:hypothetical protein
MTSTLNILDHTGDTELTWDHDRDVEVRAAREMFASLKKKGYLAYRVHGDDREVIREFDPAAERIVMSPQLVGG